MTFILKGVIGKVFFKEGPSQRCHFATHSNLGKTLTLLSHSVELPASARVIVTWFSLWATTPSGSELAVKLAQSSPSWPDMGGLWKPSGTSRKKGKEKVSVVRAVKEVLQSRIPLPGFLASWLSLLFWEPWQVKKKTTGKGKSQETNTLQNQKCWGIQATQKDFFSFLDEVWKAKAMVYMLLASWTTMRSVCSYENGCPECKIPLPQSFPKGLNCGRLLHPSCLVFNLFF